MKKIGLLGGTFDPFHFGHVHLGLELQEHHKLDEVVVCPASRSPLKDGQKPHASGEQRLEMASLGIEGIPGWRSIDWELQRAGLSYTIDTVQAFHAEADKNKEKIALYLLLGEDIVEKLTEWKEIEKLFILATPLIGVRRGEEFPLHNLPPFLEKKCRSGMTPTRVMEMSSTLIRDRLKRKLYCGHLMPAKVLDFIYHYQLYLH